MVVCSQCGKKNSADAEYCTKCGSNLGTRIYNVKRKEQVDKFTNEIQKSGKKTGKNIERAAKTFGEEAEELGRRVGRKAEKTGRELEMKMKNVDRHIEARGHHIERRIDRASKGFDSWYNRTFGIFGPLLSSLVGLIILRLVVEVFRIQSHIVPVLGDVGNALYSYIALIFIMMVLSSYTTYIARRYKPFRWVSPILSAIVVTVILWVVEQILLVNHGYGDESIAEAASIIGTYLPTIFVFVVVVGYVVQVMRTTWDTDR